MTDIILGTDGRKMSSSWGNTINLIDAPEEMFGKVMSIPDNLIIGYFEHCTRVAMPKVSQYKNQLSKNQVNPRDLKLELAYEITKIYWAEKGAKEGQRHFSSVIQHKEVPDDLPQVKLAGKSIVEILVSAKLAQSNSEARRLIEEKAVKVNGQLVESINEQVKKGSVVQKGKRHFIKVI